MARNPSVGFDELWVQLKMVNRLLVAQLQPGQKRSQADVVMMLAQTGATARDIADVVGTTVGTVGVTLSRHKKRPTGKRKTKQ